MTHHKQNPPKKTIQKDNLKCVWRKTQINYKIKPIRITEDISTEILKSRKA